MERGGRDGKSQKSSAAAVGGLGLLMRIGMGQAQLSRGVLCRHTPDNMADGSSRLPSEGGSVVRSSRVRLLGSRARKGREETGRRSGCE